MSSRRRSGSLSESQSGRPTGPSQLHHLYDIPWRDAIDTINSLHEKGLIYPDNTQRVFSRQAAEVEFHVKDVVNNRAECPPGWVFFSGRWVNLDTGEVAPRLIRLPGAGQQTIRGDDYFDDDDPGDIEGEVALDMTKEQCEQFAMALAKAVEGKWIHALVVQGYVNDSYFEVEGDFLVRISRPSCKGDILRWTTAWHIDPYWDFSVCYPWPVLPLRKVPLGSPFMYGVTVRRRERVDQT